LLAARRVEGSPHRLVNFYVIMPAVGIVVDDY